MRSFTIKNYNFQFTLVVDNEEEKHECFVFISDKLAEEITLTIGQAFELAYRRFLDTSGKDLESQRRVMVTQQRIKRLEQEVNIYKKRLLDVAQFAGVKSEIDQYLRRQELNNILELPSSVNAVSNFEDDHVNGNGVSSENSSNHKLVDLMMSSNNEITNGIVFLFVYYKIKYLYFKLLHRNCGSPRTAQVLRTAAFSRHKIGRITPERAG